MQAYLEGKVSCQEEKAEAQQGSEEAASVTCGQSGRGEVSTQPWLSALSQSPSPRPGNTEHVHEVLEGHQQLVSGSARYHSTHISPMRGHYMTPNLDTEG